MPHGATSKGALEWQAEILPMWQRQRNSWNGREQIGSIDVFVNNSGTYFSMPFTECSVL
jgi:hypothetical protein